MPQRERLTYQRARLILGLSNVGFWVALAVVALQLDWPGQFFPTEPLAGKKLAIALGAFVAGYAILQAPFDWIGGYILPVVYRRYYEDFGEFITQWMRGLSVQAAIFFGIGWTFLNHSQAALGCMAGWTFILLLLQMPLARLVGTFYSRGENGWKSVDDAFTGGIAGMPGLQSVIFSTGRGQRLRAMDERRRHHLQRLGLPTAGVIIAVAFNSTGFLLVSNWLRHPLGTVSGLVELALWFTLWSFFGVLILPALSRPAVYAGDYALFAKGVSIEEFKHYMSSEFAQVGEENGSSVERIFHPVPSPESRLARWGKPPKWPGGWHAARYATFLSWAGLSLINRSVHCNIGKPNVWVMLPCD